MRGGLVRRLLRSRVRGLRRLLDRLLLSMIDHDTLPMFGFPLSTAVTPNGLRFSGERSGAERVRCNRGLDANVLLSRYMRRRYAWAGMLFNGPQLASAGNH